MVDPQPVEARGSHALRRSSTAAAALALLAACPFAFEYAPGTIKNPSEGPMAPSDAWLFAYTPPGNLVRLRVDGSATEPFLDAPLRIVDGDPQGHLLVLSDSDTNLFVRRRPGEAPTPVPELAGRLSDACLSADGTMIAAIHHADFDTPQPRWRDDDAVYVIDVATLAVRIAPAASERMPTTIRCDAAAPVVWVSVIDGVGARVELTTLARSEAPRPEEGLRGRFPPQPQAKCPETGATVEARDLGDDGIDYVAADGTRRHLVVIEGRKRGFHDYHRTVRDVGFVPGCAHVHFSFDDGVWITDVESGVTRRLLSGSVVGVAPAP